MPTYCKHDPDEWCDTDDGCAWCDSCGGPVCDICGAWFETVNDEVNAPPCLCYGYIKECAQ